MDLLVLAAGRNERLAGIVAPYHKPLMLVDGEPLIKRIIRSAWDCANDIVVVVAPQNAEAVTQVLDDLIGIRSIRFVVQPRAEGPAQAAYIGSLLCSGDMTIACADNLIPTETMHHVMTHPGTMSYKMVFGEDALRFTRIKMSGTVLVEDKASDPSVRSVKHKCWVGPVSVRVTAFQQAFFRTAGPSLSRVLQGCMPFTYFDGACDDLGTPLSLEKV